MTQTRQCGQVRIGRHHAFQWGLAGILMMLVGWSDGASAHSNEPGERSIVLAPRAEARIGAEEAVIAYVNQKVVVFLQKYFNGLPTSGAEVAVTIDFIEETLEEVAPGIYRSGEWLLATGRNDVDLAYTLGDQTEAFAMALILPSSGDDDLVTGMSLAVPVGSVSGVMLALLVIVIYGCVNWLLARRPSRA